MLYRTLGRTGLSVSEIGLGCEHLQGKDAATVKAVVDEAIEQGINILDVFMSEPNVRTDIGHAIQGQRERLILQGHIGAAWKDGQYARTRDPGESRFFFEDLLTRLGTDYMDIGMLHFVDTDADYAEVFESDIIKYAEALKRDGVIRALGLSSHNPVIAKRAVETGLIDVLMFSVNPAYDLMPALDDINAFFEPQMLQKNQVNGIHPERAALYTACERVGCGITVMKTFCGGMLLHKDPSPFGEALRPGQCIRYALTRPAVGSVLIGCVTPEQVREAAAYDPDDPENDFSSVFAIAPRFNARGVCVYCNHCLPCPSKIDIAQVNKYLDLAEANGGTAPASVAAHYAALPSHAGDCTECGQCEANCPFEVSIRERMRRAQTVFGA